MGNRTRDWGLPMNCAPCSARCWPISLVWHYHWSEHGMSTKLLQSVPCTLASTHLRRFTPVGTPTGSCRAGPKWVSHRDSQIRGEIGYPPPILSSHSAAVGLGKFSVSGIRGLAWGRGSKMPVTLTSCDFFWFCGPRVFLHFSLNSSKFRVVLLSLNSF